MELGKEKAATTQRWKPEYLLGHPVAERCGGGGLAQSRVVGHLLGLLSAVGPKCQGAIIARPRSSWASPPTPQPFHAPERSPGIMGLNSHRLSDARGRFRAAVVGG